MITGFDYNISASNGPESIKSINARVLMPGGDKTGSHACVTFVLMKLKVVLLCKVYFVFKILFNKSSFCLL